MEEQKKEFELNIDNLVYIVHNKIALWHNADCNVEERTIALKALSYDLVENILSAAFANLKDVKTKVKVIPGEPKKQGIIKNIFGSKEKNKL